ncbi:MAG: FtsX-like permease family protein [Bacteroidales bacterium]
MNLPLRLAQRYLISKKSHNAINLISLVSVCGVAVITAALICTLSVFNGFQDLISTLYSAFDPELKVERVKGKYFHTTDSLIADLREMPEIAIFSEVLEENALINYDGRQLPALVKGVSPNFEHLSSIDRIIVNGKFRLKDQVTNYATLGVGLASQLGVNAGFVRPLELYVPKRTGKINLANPADSFNEGRLFVGGVFRVNQMQYDDQLLIASIDFARDLFGEENLVSSIQLKLKPDVNPEAFKKQLKKQLGDDYRVLNRMEQQADSFRIMEIEKWVTYLIMVFILMIAAFNVVGSLSMLIIDKKADVDTLKKLGASDSLIGKIFLFEGWLITGVGAFVGVILGVSLCLAQQYFGIMRLGDASGMFIVDSYPVLLLWSDLISVVITVGVIGFFAAIYPVRALTKTKK